MTWIKTGQGVALAIFIAMASAAVTAVAISPRHVSGAAMPPQQSVGAATPTSDTLTVVGQGTGNATPDQATVNLGVAASAPTVAAALAQAGTDMTHLITSLHGQGVQDQDIQTSGISASQDANCCPRNVTGYSASAMVTVLVHHLNNVSALITAAVDSVGNDIQLNGLNLAVSDSSSAARAARTAAMSDASARAAAWAALAGRHLGRILAVSETVLAGYGGCGGCGGAGAAGGGIPVMAGQSQFSLSVSVVYELLS